MDNAFRDSWKREDHKKNEKYKHRHKHKHKSSKKKHTKYENVEHEKPKHKAEVASEGNVHNRHSQETLDLNGKEKDKRSPYKASCSIKTEVLDYKFEWEHYRRQLDRIFFGGNNFIQRGSQEHTDFWKFLNRYISFQKKKASDGYTSLRSGPESCSTSGIPAVHDKKHKINLKLCLKPDSTALADLHGRREEKDLTEERLEQFKDIITYYVDFTQKQKFVKLQKIRKDRENLPIYKFREKIIEVVKSNQVVVVAGDTGCGKSTQVPQYLLTAGFDKIACTQPRRIACISLARRVSHETLNEYGSEVAYQVRFEKSKTQSTKILFLTEGLLLRQISSDPLLTQYSVIVIDEVHERHIHTDFLLGVLKCLLKQRSDLKVVLMSATINIELFSGYFDDAPVVSVPGRLYPIQLQYIPLSVEQLGSKTEKLDASPYLRVLQSIDHKYLASERGDVLMFLSGMTEIMTIVDAAKQYASKNKRWIVLPLHSALSVAEQEKVFDFPPEGVRKCIVSTNISETSVTIDGVRFVVDSGKVKEMSFDTKYKMQRLQEFWISKASSEQRKGRAGRTGPGVCFRLYAESDYDELQEYSTPEIQRVPLDSLILQMIAMGLPDARKFPFIEPPDSMSVETSIAYLKEQNAITEEESLTAIGNMLSQLPVDVVIGKMLIMASVFQMTDPIRCISAALSVQSPFTMKAQRDYDAMTARQKLNSDHGDPLTLLNAYDEWISVKSEGQDSRKWCKRRGLEEQRFYEMSKLSKQFKELLEEHGLVEKKESFSSEKTREERKELSQNRKRLRDLRHEQKSQGKKRKILKLDDEDWEVDQGMGSDTETHGDEPDIDSDIKDLEFRLTTNLSQVQSGSRSFTLKDINVLKVILCSGLYPQLAIADEHNSFKADSEQAFHTKAKGFVLLHPTSVLSSEPEVLVANETKERDHTTKEAALRGVISNQHQLLAFVSLLETNKAYLTGTMRVPALQTLLLFSAAIDTNSDCTRLVCDSWLELCTENSAEEAEELLSRVIKLRETWQLLIELKLKAHQKRKGLDDELAEGELKYTVKRQQKAVSQKLAEFIQCDVHYTLRRVLAAEAAKMYLGPTTGEGSDVVNDILQASGKPHPVKGGVQVTPYLVIGCLEESSCSAMGEYSTVLQKHWTCSRCQQTLVVTVAQRLLHEQKCCKNHEDEHKKLVSESIKEEKPTSSSIPRKPYHCSLCNELYEFSTAEILRHRKSCKAPKPSKDP